MRLKAFFYLVPLALLSSTLMAQNGKIRGKVFDDETGEPAFYAATAVVNTDVGAVTDIDGNFEVSVPPGTYDLNISFIGMATTKVTGIVVNAGEVTVVDNIRLKPLSNELEGVTVTAEAIRNTETALLTVKRKSANVMDGISAQNFRRIGDNNAAAAVTRVPGVSVQGGKYVYVRGLGDRYTKTQLSGMDIPGLDPDRNSIQMDIFPTNIIQNILVLKSFTADLPADFTGGVVNIETKDFPEQKTFVVNASVGYNPDMHFNSNYRDYEGGATDFLGIDNGNRDLPIDKATIIPAAEQVDPTTTNITRSFNSVLQAERQTSLMNFNLGLSTGNQIKGEKLTYGYKAALSYKNNTTYYEDFQTGEYIKPDESENTELLADKVQVSDQGINSVFLNALVGGAIKTERSKYSVDLMHLQNGESSAAYIEQDRLITGSVKIFKDNLMYTERSLSNAMFGGEHILNEDASWKVDWKVSPTFSRIEDKDLRTTPYRFDDGQFSIEPSEAENPTRIWRNLTEFNVASRADAVREHKMLGYNAKAKFGLGYTFKRRDFEILDYFLRVRNISGITLTGEANELLEEDFLWTVNNDMGSYMQGNFIPSNTYEAAQTNFALYFSEEFQFANRWKSIVGLRMEKYDHFYTGQNQAYINGDRINGINYDNEKVLDLLDFFPSLNLIYLLNENANLRMSYSRTTARPSFKEQSIAQIADPFTGRTFIGNINLVQTDIDNFDIRWETFLPKGQTFAVSAFYKAFTNPIELVAFDDSSPDNFQPRNLGNSQVFGLEFEARKNLAFIAKSLENLSVNANVTIVESRLEFDKSPNGEFESRTNNLRDGESIDDYRLMQGQAPYIINAGLAYNDLKKGWEGSLFYNVQGKRLAVVGIGPNPDIFDLPFHSLNLNILRSFGENNKYQVRFAIKNILDDQVESVYQSYNSSDKVFSLINPGRTFTIGFRYSFL